MFYLTTIGKILGCILFAELWFRTRYNLKSWTKKKKSKKLSLSQQLKKYNKVDGALFFPDPICPYLYQQYMFSNIDLKTTLVCPNPKCNFQHAIDKSTNRPWGEFINLIACAKKSLDICVWLFTNKALANICIILHEKKNILIRVIIGERDQVTSGNQIPRLKQAGVQITHSPQMTSGYMHNKFVIIDKNVIMTGSLNWTQNAFYQNHENVIVTSQPDIVQEYLIKYNTMWQEFK